MPFYAIAEGRITKVDNRHPDPPLGRGVGVEDGNYITQDCGGGNTKECRVKSAE